MDLATWMTDLPEKVTEVSINQLAIPGSHDSGAYYIDPESPFVSDRDDDLKLKCFGDCAKHIVVGWSVTQSLNFTEQLQAGIRYFDMRTGFLLKDDDFFIVHRLYGNKTLPLLQEIGNFLSTHPKEVIILDFQQFYGFTDELHDRFSSSVKDLFAAKFFPPGSVNSTLKDIWTTNTQVIVRYNDLRVTGKNSDFWPVDTLYSPWANVNKISNLITFLDSRLTSETEKQINIFQAILSPYPVDITKGLICCCCPPTNLKELEEKSNKELERWLEDKYSRKVLGVNVFMCDFITPSTCTESVIKLNELHI